MIEIIHQFKLLVISTYSHLSTEEISGSLGDLGTLLPLLVALSAQRSIALAPALFFGGLSNLISGLIWDVPMCVQPMKSIAAVALSESWGEGRVTAAGLWMGILVLILGATSLIELVNKIVPGNVVSGLQIGVGIRLASKGIQMVGDLGWLDGYDCILLGVLCSLLCMYWLSEAGYESPRSTGNSTNSVSSRSEAEDGTDRIHDLRPSRGIERIRVQSSRRNNTERRKHPVGVYLFLIGAVFAAVTLATTKNENNQFDLPLRLFGAPIAIWALDGVSAEDWKYGFLEGAIR